MHKTQEATKCEAGYDDDSPGVSTDYNSLRKIRTRNKDWSDEKNPEFLVSMNCFENYTQSSTEFQQRSKSLDNTYATRHADIVCNTDGASNGGFSQPAFRTVEDHAMVPPQDVEEDMIATLASVAPCASPVLSSPILPVEWSCSDLKGRAFDRHARVEHKRDNSRVSEIRSGLPKSKKTIRPKSLLNRNSYLSRRFRNHAHTETQGYVNHSVYHEADTSGAKVKQLHVSRLLPEYENAEGSEAEPEMLLQPETRPISHEQLVIEVKSIYAGLVMVEAKCIDIDERQSATAQKRDPSKRTDLKDDQWQSLIALHKQLLHEQHDFFLASQHPSASPALSRLAAKCSMPARMWRHGIHAFLEVLRHRLPESLDHMLAFIYIAYSMIALLYETVATFEDTWIESLGDLGRYRMALEDDEPKDREVWSNVAQHWYNKASDKSPNAGRLYHHLAILARPYTLEQLSLYTRSLTCVTPFESAKVSIITLFNPILNGKKLATHRLSLFEAMFNRVHGILFTEGPGDPSDLFHEATKDYEADEFLDSHDFPKPARKAHRSLPEDFVLPAHLYSLLYFPETWTTDVKIDDGERSCDLPSMAEPRMEHTSWMYNTDYRSQVREYKALMSKLFRRTRVDNTLRLGRQMASASRCIGHTKYSSRVRKYAALVAKALRRKRLSVNSYILVPFIVSFLPAVIGSPIGNQGKADVHSSIAPSGPLLAGSLYVGFAAAALATAHSLAAKRGPIRVWACMMGISAYGWWAVRNDVTASQFLSMADLGVWAISAFQYGTATFQEFRIPERVLLITLLGAAILDMAIVSFMTPNGNPILQSDLLSLSLPATSLSLAITANLFGCFRNQPSPLPNREMETGIPTNRGDLYRGDASQQRSTVPCPSVFRPRLPDRSPLDCFRNQPPSPPSRHEIEAEVLISRVNPHDEGLFQQRSTIPYPSTSRPRVLESSLSEMETEVSINRGNPYNEGPFQQRPTTPYPNTSRPRLLSNPLRTPAGYGWTELPAA